MPSTATTSAHLPIPTTPYTVTRAYAVEPVLYEDGAERRFLLSREQGRGLVYQYSDVDSSVLSAIQTVWNATQGPVGCFWATDYEDGTDYIVRFADASLSWSRSIHQTLTIPLRVVGP